MFEKEVCAAGRFFTFEVMTGFERDEYFRFGDDFVGGSLEGESQEFVYCLGFGVRFAEAFVYAGGNDFSIVGDDAADPWVGAGEVGGDLGGDCLSVVEHLCVWNILVGETQ